MSKLTRTFLAISAFSAMVADIGAYINVFCKTEHAEGNKKLAKVSLCIAILMATAAYISSKGSSPETFDSNDDESEKELS